VAGSCKCGDETSGSGATELVTSLLSKLSLFTEHRTSIETELYFRILEVNCYARREVSYIIKMSNDYLAHVSLVLTVYITPFC
jgi:hypothetical protein